MPRRLIERSCASLFGSFVLFLVAVPSAADSACTYQPMQEDIYRDGLGGRQGTWAAYVRPTVPRLNVRASGEASPIVGHLTAKQWAEVTGSCGRWLEIRRGMLRGWVAQWLVCQDPDVHVQLRGNDQSEQWIAAIYCGR